MCLSVDTRQVSLVAWAMPIALKRIYETPIPADGKRILVERLWPRGISKGKAAVDFWAKDTAPSHGLRTWFDHDPEKWEAFKTRYFTELDANAGGVAELREHMRGGAATFVFASRESLPRSAGSGSTTPWR